MCSATAGSPPRHPRVAREWYVYPTAGSREQSLWRFSNERRRSLRDYGTSTAGLVSFALVATIVAIDASDAIDTISPLLPYAPSTAKQPLVEHAGWPTPAPSYTQSDVSPVATVTTRSDGAPTTET